MKSFDFSRRALICCAAPALLAGCGGSQPPIGAPGAMPQTSTIAMHSERGKPWMAPEAKSDDLLYVSDDGTDQVYVFSYPSGSLSGTLTGFGSPVGECVDKAGNVWIGNQTPPEIIEYAHGGTAPIAVLSDSTGVPMGCAVDSTTGNLAVGNSDNVAIYENARGNPTTYTDPYLDGFAYCTYDKKGNLFIDGESSTIVAELAKGSDSLSNVTLSKTLSPGSMQWNSGNLVIRDDLGGSHGPMAIDRFQVLGTTASFTGTTWLKGLRDRKPDIGVQYWVQGRRIIGPGHTGANLSRIIEVWRYPRGGRPEQVIRPPGAYLLWGTVVSAAPK